MVEVAGIEPASAIMSSSSHPQVCLVYFRNKKKYAMPHQPLIATEFHPTPIGDTILIFYFRWNLPVIRYWVTRSAKTQQAMPLKRRLGNDYCYWQLSKFQ